MKTVCVNPIAGPEYRTLALKIYAGVETGQFSPDEAATFFALSLLANAQFESVHPELPKSAGISWDDFKALLDRTKV